MGQPSRLECNVLHFSVVDTNNTDTSAVNVRMRHKVTKGKVDLLGLIAATSFVPSFIC